MASPTNNELPKWMDSVIKKLRPVLSLGSYEVHHDNTGKAVRLKVNLNLDERQAVEAGLLN